MIRCTWLVPIALVVGATAGASCGDRMDVGSDLIWTARFESGALDEWTRVAGGGVVTSPSSGEVVASPERAHGGAFSARMTMMTPASPPAALSVLRREGDLPDEAYYSAWFYLTEDASVTDARPLQYWAVMRFRGRSDIANPDTVFDFLDVALRKSPSGGLILRVFDYDQFADAPMVIPDPPVLVGRWFHVEALHKNAPGAARHVVLWLDGSLVVDIPFTAGDPGWVGWSVGEMGLDLVPPTVTVFVDDCAISRVRVGPNGRLAW
jgi:hypothetical protein